MQPNIFMWGGLLKSIIDSDLHIILDDVKSSKNARYNRNRIAGNSNPIWLTLPFVDFKREKEILFQNLNTSKSIKGKLINCFSKRYSEAIYFNKSFSLLEKTIPENKDISNLCEIYLNFLNILKDVGMPLCKIIFASELLKKNPEFREFKGIKLINNLLIKTEAETYLASENTMNYAKPSEYSVSNVWVQKFSAKEYPQLTFKKNQTFEPNLSILDMISYLNNEEIFSNLDKSNFWIKYYNY